MVVMIADRRGRGGQRSGRAVAEGRSLSVCLRSPLVLSGSLLLAAAGWCDGDGDGADGINSGTGRSNVAGEGGRVGLLLAGGQGSGCWAGARATQAGRGMGDGGSGCLWWARLAGGRDWSLSLFVERRVAVFWGGRSG